MAVPRLPHPTAITEGPVRYQPRLQIMHVGRERPLSWMSDDCIDAALSQVCVVCGVAAGFECVHEVSGKPLSDVVGRPVHAKRLEP